MTSLSCPECELLVIGGGPAGLAAAATAAECGSRVLLVDDNPALGGQIWRGESSNCASEASAWVEKLRVRGVNILGGTQVVDRPHPSTLLAESNEGPVLLQFEKLVLATGARERFLPFPGWTLPNVMGAGGLQALVKSGLPIAGKRVVVAGSGPLLLAVAAYLRKHGADVPAICEQAEWRALARFGAALAMQPQKLKQALSLKSELRGVRYAPNSWVMEAHGDKALQAVTVNLAGRPQRIECDYLACGFHLVPNIELAALLGCVIADGCVRVDELQRTSIANIYCAGEPTGIGGVELSTTEGRIAGFAASGRPEKARTFIGAKRKAQRFAVTLNRSFQLRSELRRLCRPDTFVCRCEDVAHGRLSSHSSWRAAKLQARVGMGPCQGRVCGPAAEFLFHWRPDSVRPPIFPTRFSTLAGTRTPAAGPLEVTGGHS